MTARFQPPARPLLVYTDLDGTLLDHDSYSFEAARPALQRLRQLGVPVIPVTSKTLAELEVLLDDLDLDGPCVAENGSLVAIPDGYFADLAGLQPAGRFQVEYLSPRYRDILDMLHALRRDFGYVFTGFADIDDRRIAEITGLEARAAQRARQRLCSEPLMWQDTASAFDDFSQQLQQRGYTLVRGGRFFHVLGQKTDKAFAIERLGQRYSQNGFSDFTSIALGDSPNDIRMLQAADIAVVVRRKDGDWLQLDTPGRSIRTQASGPEGWNEFFMQQLDTPAPADTGKRTGHG